MHFIRSPPPRNCVKNAIIQNPRSYRDYAPADPVFLYGSLASIKMTIHTYFKLYSNYWFIDGAQISGGSRGGRIGRGPPFFRPIFVFLAYFGRFSGAESRNLDSRPPPPFHRSWIRHCKWMILSSNNLNTYNIMGCNGGGGIHQIKSLFLLIIYFCFCFVFKQIIYLNINYYHYNKNFWFIHDN